ncbi:hypothetical protein SDC9_151768 [bioreactor metagenome]|uniref:Uncharacterized protein n=1 Tax=bioreactor metagenome TaxID=1076179 RepID=A0A645ERS3_9ZZZZ
MIQIGDCITLCQHTGLCILGKGFLIAEEGRNAVEPIFGSGKFTCNQIGPRPVILDFQIEISSTDCKQYQQNRCNPALFAAGLLGSVSLFE